MTDRDTDDINALIHRMIDHEHAMRGLACGGFMLGLSVVMAWVVVFILAAYVMHWRMPFLP